MINAKGGKGSSENRIYGYSDVIKNKVRSLTENTVQKDTLTLIVCPFSHCTSRVTN